MRPVGRGLWISRHTSKIPSVNKWAAVYLLSLPWQCMFVLFLPAQTSYRGLWGQTVQGFDLVAMETTVARPKPGLSLLYDDKCEKVSVEIVWRPEGGR